MVASKVIGLITARGGSKGIPRKNVKPLAGKPLIAWTIEAAARSKGLDRIIVSTDDNEIASVARQWGGQVPFMRPPALAQDDSSHISVVVQAIHWLEEHERYFPDYIMLLQPTSPLRTADDIDGSIQMAEINNTDAVVSVCAATHHPYLCKRICENGTLGDFVSSEIEYLRRQDLPHAYVLNGAIYLNRTESLLRDQTFFPQSTYPYVMPPERSLDIDTPWDWRVTELILHEAHG